MNIVATVYENMINPFYHELAKLDGQTVQKKWRVRHIPKDIILGKSRIYFLWKNRVRGSLLISYTLLNHVFVCSTTGKEWAGNFLVCDGPWRPLHPELSMRGFQGWRYFGDDGAKIEPMWAEERRAARARLAALSPKIG